MVKQADTAFTPFLHEPETIAGKSIVVSGGTTGIGRATATLLASLGAKVLVFGRHAAELQDALHSIGTAAANGGQVFGHVADQARWDDLQRVFASVDEQLGGIDVLIANAAIGGESVLDDDFECWKYVIDANLVGTMACTKLAIERMLERGRGHVVLVGSMSADEREVGSDVYVATKAAVQGFAESLGKKINPQGIRVSLIEPGSVGTDMDEHSPRQQRRLQEKHEMLKAEDIASCVVYCLIQPQRCDVVEVRIRPRLQTI